MGVGLGRSLQPWVILLIYCNNQLKKYIAPLQRLVRGHSLMSMSMSEAFSVPFHALIKLCYTKALKWSSLVPGPEAKSSLEIMNLTLSSKPKEQLRLGAGRPFSKTSIATDDEEKLCEEADRKKHQFWRTLHCSGWILCCSYHLRGTL